MTTWSRLSATGALAFGCASDPSFDPWTPPESPGAFGVGARTLSIPRDGLPELTVEVWYPTEAEDEPGAYEASGLRLTGGAIRDAAPAAGGPWPVVAFSHGFGGIRFQSYFLTEHLARHGYVVVAPDHPGTNLLDLRDDETAYWAARRPTDVRDAVDALAELADLQVETDSYAVVGHSFGAWTAMVVAGGRLDPAAFAARCAGADPEAACRFFRDQAFDAGDVATFAQPDPRARVAVLLTPGAWYSFGADGAGLADVAPAMVVGGALDDELPYEPETTGTWAAIGAPASLVTLEAAGHWVFTDLCPIAPIADCAGPASGFVEASVAHAAVAARATAWIDVHHRGDARSAPGLRSAPGVGFVARSAADR